MSEESEAVSLTRESAPQRLSADTVLFFSSVEIDETWTRSTVLACVDAGLCVAVAIVGLQTSVEGGAAGLSIARHSGFLREGHRPAQGERQHCRHRI